MLSRGVAGSLQQFAATFAHFPIDSKVFLLVFLPALVFHGGLSIDVRRLARDTAPVLVLAMVAVVGHRRDRRCVAADRRSAAHVCLLLGAIVATTDPSAVIGVFRNIGVDARLARLVEGESLLNDAAAIALFTLLLDQVRRQASPDLAAAGALLVASLVGGAAVGYWTGAPRARAIPLLSGSRAAEVTLTLALPYVSYIVYNNFLGFSGVVAAAAAGLTAGSGPPCFGRRVGCSWSMCGRRWRSWRRRWCSGLLPCWCRG